MFRTHNAEPVRGLEGLVDALVSTMREDRKRAERQIAEFELSTERSRRLVRERFLMFVEDYARDSAKANGRRPADS
jgi:hypothetical protein